MSTPDMITFDINTVLSIGACLASLAALAAVFSIYKSLQHWRGRCLMLEANMPSLRREVEMVASLNARTGRQIKQIADECLDVQDRVELVEQRGNGRAVGDAVVSARRGADLDKLTQQFGLSRGEAELVNRLHGQRRSA